MCNELASPNGAATATNRTVWLYQTLDVNTAGGPGVFDTAIQPDGKIIIGGNFSSVLGTARINIVRLNNDERSTLL